jgi:hypothetical protein
MQALQSELEKIAKTKGSRRLAEAMFGRLRAARGGGVKGSEVGAFRKLRRANYGPSEAAGAIDKARWRGDQYVKVPEGYGHRYIDF